MTAVERVSDVYNRLWYYLESDNDWIDLVKSPNRVKYNLSSADAVPPSLNLKSLRPQDFPRVEIVPDAMQGRLITEEQTFGNERGECDNEYEEMVQDYLIRIYTDGYRVGGWSQVLPLTIALLRKAPKNLGVSWNYVIGMGRITSEVTRRQAKGSLRTVITIRVPVIMQFLVGT